MRTYTGFWFVLCGLVGACGDGAATGKGDGAATEADAELGVSYHGEIRAAIEANCLGCHVEGGIAPFALDDWEAVEPYAGVLVDAVMAGVMPPWPAATDCHPIAGVRRLDDETLGLFEAWRDNGFAEGDEDAYQAPEEVDRVALGEPDIMMDSGEGYASDGTLTDDYRCFVMQGGFDADTFVTAIDILPGIREQVHHVQIHTIPGGGYETALANDAASDGPGYTCFGGVNVPGSYNLFSWRPGTLPVAFPEGEAVHVEAGSRVVIQVHYNVQWLTGAAEEDLTRIAFWTLPEGELPERIIRRQMALGLGVNIPAGASEATTTAANAMRGLSAVGGKFLAGEIIGITPHMHNLGSRFAVNLRRGDASEECLVRVDDWDFEWQFDYMYEPDATLPVRDDDVLDLTCVYDNSPEHQPVINGERLQPRQVGWGEGSLDEMCLAYVWIRYDRDAYFDR